MRRLFIGLAAELCSSELIHTSNVTDPIANTQQSHVILVLNTPEINWRPNLSSRIFVLVALQSQCVHI